MGHLHVCLPRWQIFYITTPQVAEVSKSNRNKSYKGAYYVQEQENMKEERRAIGRRHEDNHHIVNHVVK